VPEREEERAEAEVLPQPTPRFGASGNVVLAVDRIGVIQFYTIRLVDEGEQRQVDQTGFDINLFHTSSIQGSDARPMGIFLASSIPRFSLDGFVADSFSLGGLFGMSYSSAEMEDEDESEGLPGVYGVLLGFRLGYGPSLGSGADAWLTAGLGYLYQSMDDDEASSLTVSHLMSNLEATLLLGVSERVALGFGIFFDGTLSGAYGIDTQGSDVSTYSLGVVAAGLKVGLFGWAGRAKTQGDHDEDL
jgi:hypothetical protein